jgi:hypothetical protein
MHREILMNFQSLQNLENYNRISRKKITRGLDLPWTGPIRRETGPDPAKERGVAAASNLPAGQAGQPAWDAEAVRAISGRPIK